VGGVDAAIIAVQPGLLVMTEGEDPNLVALAREGDAAAREALAVRWRRFSYLTALQLVGNREDALDIAQDALIRLLGSLGRLQEGRPLRPWLARIVHNLVRDHWRRRRVRRSESLDEAVALALVDHRESPEETVRRRELQVRLARALRALSPNQREILVLRDYQGMSYAEIAAALRIPLGTVMSRLHGARTRLRASIGEGLQ
jgi:RNA polymerase sigma-70 factor, ECF subfamily